MTRKFAAILIVVFSILGSMASFATIEEGRFGLADGSGEWRKEELQQWLESRFSKDISRFLSPKQFTVYANVTFKGEKNTIKRVANVTLSKFGTVATLYQGEKIKPEQGLFGKIAQLDVTVIVDKEVDESLVLAMQTIIQNNVPVIKKDKIAIDVVRVKRPGLGLLGWMRELNSLLITVFVISIVCLLLYKLGTSLRFNLQWSVHPARKPREKMPSEISLVTPLEALVQPVGESALEIPQPERKEAPLPVGMELQDSHLLDTLESLELRKLRAKFLDLSFEQRLQISKTDVPLASIMFMLLPKEQVEHIGRVISAAQLKSITEQNTMFNKDEVIKSASDLYEKIAGFAASDASHNSEFDARISVYVEQVGYEQEESVFDQLLAEGKYQSLETIARKSPPARVLAHAGLEYLGAAFQKASLRHRALIIIGAPVWLEERLSSLRYPSRGANTSRVLDQEIEKLRKELTAERLKELGLEALNALFADLRTAYRRNKTMQSQLEPVLQDWLHIKSKGVINGGRKIA